MKQVFQQEFGDIALLLNVQNDMNLFRDRTQFWNPGYSCLTFEKVDMNPTIKEYTMLLHCPKFKEGKVYPTTFLGELDRYHQDERGMVSA
ncbi:hypothetical protein HRI_000760600 [Hibiscus trionum]|uniref:DUF7745 domain-containing protein n=1 Tax=Hibiscus trionum TaxID=183268 RepID=A0A9W7H5Q0_HIBTR|nr:hypothetical protein HRI_000760600 [Hibiscus trionum]